MSCLSRERQCTSEGDPYIVDEAEGDAAFRGSDGGRGVKLQPVQDILSFNEGGDLFHGILLVLLGTPGR